MPERICPPAPTCHLLSTTALSNDARHDARAPAPRATHCRPEPHILLFRRPNGTDPTTGLVGGKRIDPNTGKVL